MIITDVVDVEPVLNALENLLKQVAEFETVSRTFVPWDQILATDQPALIIHDFKETESGGRGQRDKLTLYVQLLIFFKVDKNDKTLRPSTKMNNLVKAVRKAIVPRTGPDTINGVQTLGGLVDDCRIDGDIKKDQGVLDDQGSVLIPLVITIP